MSLTTLSPTCRTSSTAELLHVFGTALCRAAATLASLPRRAQDRAILRSLDHQMLADLGQHRVVDELAKPLWRG